ncbi:MAG: glycoside hydrolase family 32 protein [Candidatus Marinimicrobia bacterium]|nr:glycoside hydrolase family 32 protein [Candidatus Neomarinimicrobiota bacterium]
MNKNYSPHNNSINYLENFRGQFHFSPKSGWMNDINGLVYHCGKYHMIYQWGKEIRHGGYATSRDLLHWQDMGVALIPQKSFLPIEAVRNVSGNHVFSGSAVIVPGKVAKKITGSEEDAIIAIYTGEGIGTCLAWSNNNGDSWHNYNNNPVANPNNSDYPRDPCLFWHQKSSKWIMAIYENGTTFYCSKDLICWEFLSNINFGYECPDIYQLPLDGDENNMKWVLQDACGAYLVGEFDGTTFTVDKGQETHKMDLGPDFYAAQTFPRGNLPNNDNRTIQIAWMDNWNGGVGEEIWERNATFPVSLGLVTRNKQKRITRNPIKEISSLYQDSWSMEKQIILPESNILSHLKSKQFDLTAEFDISTIQSGKFGFRIANKIIEYNIADHTLLSQKIVSKETNFFKIRILADWGQLEVFANDGLFSFSEEFGFIPDRDDLEFYTKIELKLKRLEFHSVERIW